MIGDTMLGKDEVHVALDLPVTQLYILRIRVGYKETTLLGGIQESIVRTEIERMLNRFTSVDNKDLITITIEKETN